jgi:hypothetical protein
MLSNLSACACLLECLGECSNRTSSATFSILDNLKSSTHTHGPWRCIPTRSGRSSLFSHLRWPQTQAMYDVKCWSARFLRFLTREKARNLVQNYSFRRSLATVLPGGRRRRLNSGSSASFSICRLLALKPFRCNRGCTAADNSLTFGSFLPAASSA